MDQLTTQQIFDRVATHLLKQGKAAVETEPGRRQGLCRYRTSDGLQCAFGCLIPDDIYDPVIEGKLAIQLLGGCWGLQNRLGLNNSAAELIVDLQWAHDSELKVGGLATWKAKMRSIAVTWSLSPSILDTQNGVTQ